MPTGSRPAWSAGRPYKELEPYYIGHVFVAYYLWHRGLTYRKIGSILGVSGNQVSLKIDQAERILKYSQYRWKELKKLAPSTDYS
jgi:hypothetical protein